VYYYFCDRNNVREEGFTSAQDFRDISLSWQGGHGKRRKVHIMVATKQRGGNTQRGEGKTQPHRHTPNELLPSKDATSYFYHLSIMTLYYEFMGRLGQSLPDLFVSGNICREILRGVVY
jgi:hypothetical protein